MSPSPPINKLFCFNFEKQNSALPNNILCTVPWMQLLIDEPTYVLQDIGDTY